MTSLFFDTSALVKRYHEESGTDRVDELIEDAGNDVIVSSLAVVETVSAFRRKVNVGDVTESEMSSLVSAFFRESLDTFVIVSLGESRIRFSFDLILDDDLRTLDSLQLSTGLVVSEEVGDVTFVTADEELAAIAERRGLAVENPS